MSGWQIPCHRHSCEIGNFDASPPLCVDGFEPETATAEVDEGDEPRRKGARTCDGTTSVGVPAAAVGVAVAIHGTAFAGTAAENLANGQSEMNFQSGGSGGKREGRGRGANKRDRKQIEDAARQAGVDIKDLRRYVHEVKGHEFRGGSENYTYEEFLEFAEELKNSTTSVVALKQWREFNMKPEKQSGLFSASLRIKDAGTLHDEILSVTGVQPSDSHLSGEPRLPAIKRMPTWTSDLWALDSPLPESSDLSEHLK